MAGYAIAHLRTPTANDEVFEYLERIQATLDPFNGRFLVHGGALDVLEGTWPGAVVVIEFPDTDSAHSWYDSAAYQAILPLRTGNIEADAVIVAGVGPAYDASSTAAAMRAQINGAS
ncbi:DUF1330 domain-containing protein [Micromonospora andamanensis]|uniref:DUF1330 domain-containing protein n=1 Tax=Micromonospora andamanensis TaxID=1287068 RepID=A0ABQ4I2H1_9ACTN|nr:DUF1330 domain-containing protein [Micromonospora andamanensis]GIJ12056.1 hypothetical protein Van01_52700 [Micromonospora andamanensis]GIJ43081.1 hypothetical protein Vwe01_64060 [Micromonospora andamanensis]